MIVRSVVEFVRDFLGFLRERKKFWLLPLLLVLLVLGAFVFFTAGSAAAPLLYSLF